MIDYNMEGSLQDFLNEDMYKDIISSEGLTVILTSGSTLTNVKIKGILSLIPTGAGCLSNISYTTLNNTVISIDKRSTILSRHNNILFLYDG